MPESGIHDGGEGFVRGAAGAVEKLYHVVLPWGRRWVGLWVGENTAVDGLSGI